MDLPFDLPAGVTLASDVSPAAWIDGRLTRHDRANGVRVSEVIPTGFAAYARIFHPAFANDGRTKLRWSRVAAERGRIVHPQMQFEHLLGTADLDAVAGIERPSEGRLPVDEVDALVEIGMRHTSTPDAGWFGIWDGYGIFGGGSVPVVARRTDLTRVEREGRRAARLRRRAEREHARLVEASLARIPRFAIHPDPEGRGALREYYLFHGPLEAASRLVFGVRDVTPNLWWPDDHAWCVATEVDGHSTYVGGSDAYIASVLEDDRLESLATSVDARFDVWSDEINPSPPGMGPRRGG